MKCEFCDKQMEYSCPCCSPEIELYKAKLKKEYDDEISSLKNYIYSLNCYISDLREKTFIYKLKRIHLETYIYGLIIVLLTFIASYCVKNIINPPIHDYCYIRSSVLYAHNPNWFDSVIQYSPDYKVLVDIANKHNCELKLK